MTGMTLTSRILPLRRGQTGKSHLLRVLEESVWAIKLCLMVDIMAGQPIPPPPRNKQGNQWLISPDHNKALFFLGGVYVMGRVG